jgi:hypothetical protein
MSPPARATLKGMVFAEPGGLHGDALRTVGLQQRSARTRGPGRGDASQ